MTRREQHQTNPNHVVGYVRVSTDEQALGPAAQEDALRRWCAARGATLIAVRADIGVSGATSLEHRPALIEVLDIARHEGAGVVLVAKRDRLARDPIVSAMVESLVDRIGARVVSAAGEGEGDDPASVLMRRMVDAFAEYERRIICARTRAALAVKRSRGQRVGQVPLGYVATDSELLAESPHERAVIEQVLRARAAGASYRAIAAQLNRSGVPARGSRWHANTIVRIVARHTGAA